MEDICNDIDLFYQINSSNEIKVDLNNYYLNDFNIKKNQYFLIELTDFNAKLSFEFLKKLLGDDGVELSQIKEFTYLADGEKGNKQSRLEVLNESNIEELKDLKKIYLHLILEEETEMGDGELINEMEKYNIELDQFEKQVKEISKEIEKEKIYNDKISTEDIFKNIQKKIFTKKIKFDVLRSNITQIKRVTAPQISNDIEGFYDDDDDEEGDYVDGTNDDFSNEFNINDLDLSLHKASSCSILEKKQNEQIDKKGKEKITMCYLFSDPLIYKDKKNVYKSNNCFNEIKTIYNIFLNSKIKCNLRFEPIVGNFNIYLESCPDILHINVESINDEENNYKNEIKEGVKKTSTFSPKNPDKNFEKSEYKENFLKICLDYLGELQYYKCKDLNNTIKTEYEISEIQLLILSTQNINDMKYFFNNIGIKNIIYIENEKTYPKPNELVINYIKELYINLLSGKSIHDSFIKTKKNFKDKLKFDIYPPSKIRSDYIISPNESIINKESYDRFNSQKLFSLNNKKSTVVLNKNCSLNLDFIKYNYRRIIGRNIELKNCIDKMLRFNNICVCGFPGAGKKSFVQHVGKFVFERNMYRDVHYLELYYLKNAEQLVNNKKKEIKSNLNIPVGYQLEYNEKKILLIINFNYVVNDINDISIFVDLISRIKDNHFNYLYCFTINYRLSFKNVKKQLKEKENSLIELNKLAEEERIDLFTFISYDLKNINLSNEKEKELVKYSNGYPNDIYLRTLYINYFYEEIKNLDFSKLTNELIFNQLIEKFELKIQKILAIFTILKLGIREDILYMFFNKEEIHSIKNELKYIIFVEEDDNGEYYLLDNSYKDLIKRIFLCKYKNKFTEYLYLTLKNYAIIFRYLVNYTNYPYSIAFEFHAGINRGFWLTLNESIYNQEFMEAYSKFKIKDDIYFDETKYFYNVLIILNSDEYINIIKNNKAQFIEYISQISICLPTLFHFQGCKLYERRIIELFKERLDFLGMKKSLLRLKIYHYWNTGNSNLIPSEGEKESNLIKDKKNEETKNLNNELKSEFYLIKMYDFTIKQDKENLSISQMFQYCRGACEKCKEKNFNLSKLNILYGKELNNIVKRKACFQNANEYAKCDNNIYMEILSLIMKAECYISENEFDKFNEIINNCEKEINLKEEYLQNTDIKDRLKKAQKDKDNKYEKYTKNHLFFFTSHPFFDENGKRLKTESNNSFYLKYYLLSELPKNLKIEFNNIKENFLSDLEKCLLNPINFLYLGSDNYNEDGNLFYSKDFKSYKIDSKLLEQIIKKSKNGCSMVILGFLNSETIAKHFLADSKKFPLVIYIKNIEELNALFRDYPYFYFYFERCFHFFVVKFLTNLKTLTIKEAFIKANYAFRNKLETLKEINEKLSKQILVMEGNKRGDDELFFENFTDLNYKNFSNSSNNNVNLENFNCKSSFEKNNLKKNFSLTNRSTFNDEEKKEISKDNDNKNMRFFKFPKEGLRDDIFEKVYNNRLYGMKEVLENLINKVLKYRFINIYGDENCGKTRICLEICKYFYMNNKFKDGIFYINLNKQKHINKHEFKLLKEKHGKNYSNKKDNKIKEITDALLVFDDFDLIKKGQQKKDCIKNNSSKNSLYSYINKLNSYTIIVTKKKEAGFSENLKLLPEILKDKNNNNKIINDVIYEDLNISIDKDFANEFINYMKITNNIKDNITINEKDDLYIKSLVEKITKENENEALNMRDKYLSSSQIRIKIK